MELPNTLERSWNIIAIISGLFYRGNDENMVYLIKSSNFISIFSKIIVGVDKLYFNLLVWYK